MLVACHASAQEKHVGGAGDKMVATQFDGSRSAGDSQTAGHGTPMSETKEEKKVRLQRERELKRQLADETRAKKKAEQQAAREEKRRRRVDAGEDPQAIMEEERMQQLIAHATEQKRRYSSLLLTAQIPINGIDSGDVEWKEFKDFGFGCRRRSRVS